MRWWHSEYEIVIGTIFFKLSLNMTVTDRPIVCLIIIVNIIFSYFNYYFLYGHFFYNVSSLWVWPVPKSPWYVHHLVKYRCLKIFSKWLADQILPCNLSESRKWIVVYIKEYFNADMLLYSLRMQCLKIKLLTYNYIKLLGLV